MNLLENGTLKLVGILPTEKTPRGVYFESSIDISLSWVNTLRKCLVLLLINN